MINIKSNQNWKSPWIIGHRGYAAQYPENTLAAFQAALDAGVKMIELDVMLSRDRKLVVCHDATLDRTTNGTGAVADFTLAELKQLDAGSWFDPQFANQQIPEIRDVLTLVGGRIYVNIEIKSEAYESHHPPDAVEKQVVELLRQENLVDTCLISSFEVKILEQIAPIEKRPCIAFISQDPADTDTVQLCRRLQCYSWHPNHRVVTRGQVDQMHAAGIRVFPYTVNTRADYTRMVDNKVDGVITDDPAQAAEWSTT